MTGQVRHRFPADDNGPVWALTTFLDADGATLLASAASGGIRVWAVEDRSRRGEPVRRDGATPRAVVAFARPDGRGTLLAGGWDDGRVQVWDPVTGEPVVAFDSDSPVHGLAVLTAPDGRRPLLAAAVDGAVRLWDALTGVPEGMTGAPSQGSPGLGSRSATGLAITAFEVPGGDTLLATAAANGVVSVWNPYPGPRTSPTSTRTAADAHLGRTVRLTTATGPDGRTVLIAEHDRGALNAFDALTGEPVDVPPAATPPDRLRVPPRCAGRTAWRCAPRTAGASRSCSPSRRRTARTERR